MDSILFNLGIIAVMILGIVAISGFVYIAYSVVDYVTRKVLGF